MAGKSADRVLRLIDLMRTRHRRKLPWQHGIHHNHLPPVDCDFAPLFELIIPADLDDPQTASGRQNLDDQKNILRHKYRGQPEILALHMLVISYLRRRTEYSKHANALFVNMWEAHGNALLQILSPRDLVSALRTFADHSVNRQRALIAKLGFQYATMIKIYESERWQTDRDPKHTPYQVPTGAPPLGVNGMYGVGFAVDNSLEIIAMHLWEEIDKDALIGPMIATLLCHIFDGATVFSRVDQARIDAEFALNLGRGWSFGFDPRDMDDETT